MSTLILGIDGGGSKTRALVADLELAALGGATLGSSNLQVVGFEAAMAALAAAAAAALAQAGAGEPAAVCLGLAGVGRPHERERVLAWARRHWATAMCHVVTDIEPVLAAGTAAGWGVALIAGTGSACLGRAPDGHAVKVGGWGYLLGDEGSGYELAVRALRLATQTADGRADAPALLQATLDHWGLAAPDALVRHVYGGLVPAAIATLARPVVALAEAGEPHACALLDESAAQLALMAATAARRLALHAPPLALAGGLLGASPRLRHAVATQLGAAWGPVNYVAEPAQGTLVLARRLLAS